MNTTVYLADDDPDDREFFNDSIKAMYPQTKLFLFCDGDELMQHLNKDVLPLPDLIFLDINMPRKNGQQCLQEIKRNDRFKKVGLIMFSTSIDERDVSFAFEKGAHLFVSKPTTLIHYMEALKEVFEMFLSKQLFENPKQRFVLPTTLRLA